MGVDRIEHDQRQQDAYRSKSLPELSHGKPAEIEATDIAVSVFASRFSGRASQSGLGGGHHVLTDVAGLHVHGGDRGLAQSLRAVLAVVEQPGEWILHRSRGRGVNALVPSVLVSP